VQVAAGSGIVQGIGIYKASSGNSGSISAAGAGDHKISVIVLQSDNTISIVEGAEVAAASAAPFPNISTSQLPLAYMDIDDTSPVVINDADINDVRYFWIDPFKSFEYFDSTIAYTGDKINTFTMTDKKNNDYVFTATYSSDTITRIDTTISSIDYRATFTYTGDQLTDVAFTIE